MSGDNKDLDALFGAFDGGESGDDNDSKDGVDKDENDHGDYTGGDGGAPSVAKVLPTASSFAAALYRPAASTSAVSSSTTPADGAAGRGGGNGGVGKKIGREKGVGINDTSAASAEREARAISTGTSHDKSIRSYSAVPDLLDPSAAEGAETAEKRPPAKVYPFKLDPFQQTAVDYIEKNESVLVAAHTSAGKTAVAEYAIAKSLRDGQRVVYTSPIKALSNQKYRDLNEEFEDVGLMTGDITINPEATCLVMTTEILRSMLYRGSEVMREVAWVIYDEVHYMRDKERGVVWEESIVLLPHRVRFVFLSATIPNARQFVDWIAKIHHQPCHVVYTNYRPVPLQHYIFPQGAEGLHLVVDEKGKFRESNFQKAMATLQSKSNTDAGAGEASLSSGNGGARGRKRKRSSFGNPKGGKGQTSDLHRIVKLIMERNLNPVIIFSFSKKDCEKYALDLNREDYTDDIEKDLISQVYQNAIEALSEDDRRLPQVEALLPLLKRGIGIHHGGLLPILKEIVEILFSEGLIKALFATETFSIGINMPAKTVVFTNTRKWDGTDFRWVTSGEYIQMSGRAGRRGKDDRGIVIQMLDEKMEPAVCKGILYGDPDPLNSSYRIKYNMLLNMLRVEDVDPEYILRASFRQYQVESEAPALEAQADFLEEEASLVVVGSGSKTDEETVGEYFQMERQLQIAQRKTMKIVQRPEHILPFVKGKGRLLDVSIDGEYFGWGVLVSYKLKAGAGSAGSAGKAAVDAGGALHTLDVLLPCVDRHFDETLGNGIESDSIEEDLTNAGMLWRGSTQHCRPTKRGDATDEKLKSWRVFTISLDGIERISAVRIFIPQDITPMQARTGIERSLSEVLRRFPEGLPLLDPVKDLKIKTGEFEKLLGRATALKERIVQHSMSTKHDDDDRTAWVKDYGHKVELQERARAIRDEARSCKGIIMRDELRKMKRVLRQLGHVDANGVIQMKGRTACEINTASELVVVELVFSGVFNDLGVEQSVALLSCMTFDERNKDEDDPTKGLKSYLSNPFYKLQECARTVAKASIACKLEVDEDEFVNKFNPGM